MASSSSRTADLGEFYKSAGREEMRAAMRTWAEGVKAELEKELAAEGTGMDPADREARAELRGGIGILDVLHARLTEQSDAPPKE